MSETKGQRVTSRCGWDVKDHNKTLPSDEMAMTTDCDYSLLCGVQELVLAASAVTDPDAKVCPEPADSIDITPLQLGDLHCVYIL